MTDSSTTTASSAVEETSSGRTGKRSLPAFKILVRRLHLYAGLFLLPWVFLYGVTGAMFNHQGLLPEAQTKWVGGEVFEQSELSKFPTAKELAQQVVDQLQASSDDSQIALAESTEAQFTNPLSFLIKDGEYQRGVYIDTVNKKSWVMTYPTSVEPLVPLLDDVKNITLDENPYELARQAIPTVLDESGFDSTSPISPLGWCKLNFLATVDGQPARVTYVLRDGHVEVTKYEGQTGLSLRNFFLRMHTTHGRTPHWNARSIWSLFVDAMALAMVTWATTGLFMWWQLKRSRRIGAVVLLLSISTAVAMYLSLTYYYAATKL